MGENRDVANIMHGSMSKNLDKPIQEQTRRTQNLRDTYEIIIYLFKKEQCKDCLHRDKCIGSKGGKKIVRKLRVTATAPLFYEKSQGQKTPEVQE